MTEGETPGNGKIVPESRLREGSKPEAKDGSRGELSSSARREPSREGLGTRPGFQGQCRHRENHSFSSATMMA